MISPERCAALALALCLLGAGGAAAQGVTAHTIVLGQSAPLSGPHRPLGEEIRGGALAYLRPLNDAGGVHGRRIELATLDDAGDPARALANTRRFIDEFRVFALFGYPDASLTRDVLALVRKSGVPLIAPISGADAARQAGRRLFAMRAGDADELDRIIGYYVQLGQRRFALVRKDGAASARLLEAARQALSRRDLPAPVDAGAGAKAAGAADVVILALPAEAAAEAVRALRRAGSGAQIVATSMADPAVLARALGRSGAGVALAQGVPPLDQVSLPLVSEYRSALVAETGRRDYSPASLEAFLGAKVLAEALRRAGRGVTRDALMLALNAMSYYDAGGYVVSFSPTSRQASGRIYLQAIGRDGALLH